MRRRPLLFIAAGLLAIVLAVPVAQAARNRGTEPNAQQHVAALVALGSGFMYQGRLTDGGGPANAAYDIRFILYDAESGGSQVGSTVEKADLAVQNGLFSTELDFGAAAFDGNARWMEIAVRPGTSTGSYTVLSPRQSITPVPYALYAKKAAGVALPLTGTGATASAGLISVTQTGEGIAVTGERTYTGTSTNPAVFGTNAGSGAGLLGVTTYDGGAAYGVIGDASGANTGTGALFKGPTALEVDGPIKVSGSAPAAFIWEVTNASICPVNVTYCTNIDHPATNGNPSALLFVTPNIVPNGTANDRVIAVNYVSGKWQIYNQDGTPLAIGDAFNVLVINR